MNAKLNGLTLGVSAIALLVALSGLGYTVTQASQMDVGVQRELVDSTETILERMDTLERQNTELRQVLATSETRLQEVKSEYAASEDRLRRVESEYAGSEDRLRQVESVYASPTGGMAAMTDRIAKLEESSAENGRAIFRFGRTLTATRQTLEETGVLPKSDALDEGEVEQEEEEEEPKLEDYLRVELNPINGLPGPHIIIEGANLHIRSGSGGTDDLGGLLYGLGNVVIGYNEQDQILRARSGSHNLVIGSGHGFSSYGGLIAGFGNEVNAPNSSVSGGTGNAANGWASSISGGEGNLATGDSSSVAGGIENRAVAKNASVTGGSGNEANGLAASISGGQRNRVTGDFSSVTGGADNQAVATNASVTGGTDNVASGLASSVTGGQRNLAIGESSSVTGGAENQTLADSSVISGGLNGRIDQNGIVDVGPGLDWMASGLQSH